MNKEIKINFYLIWGTKFSEQNKIVNIFKKSVLLQKFLFKNLQLYFFKKSPNGDFKMEYPQ